MASAGDDSERAPAQTKNGDRGVDVVITGEPLRLTHGAVGIHLDDLLAGHVSDRVEIMDAEVPEDPTRGRDIGLRRRSRIMRRGTHQE